MSSPDLLAADFSARLEPHGPLLLRYVRRLVDSREAASDVLQSALGNAFAAHGRFDPESSFRSWIYRFATNEALNHRRRERRWRARPLAEGEEPVDDAPDIELELAYERVLADPDRVVAGLDEPLARALKALSPQIRAAFLLRSLAELGCAEIAATLEVPKGTVVSWLFRARMRLRRELAAHARDRDAVGEQR